MFRRLSEPLPLSEASLLLLRPAMNAPVLNVGYLPVGPARAAVVAFAEEYGGIGIALGVRSSESGQLAVLRNQESIDFDVRLVDALEPLLAVAERMGFLFDEDMLAHSPGPKGHSDAMVHWAGLMGGMDNLIPPRSVEPPTQVEAEDAESVGPLSPSLAVEESQYPELILDDVAPLELSGANPPPPAGDDDTFDADPEADLETDLDSELDADADFDSELEEELDDTLEGVLEQAMAEGLADGLDVRLDDGDADWALEDPLGSDLDLTEPTTPILAPRVAAPPRPAPAPAAAPTPARFVVPASVAAPAAAAAPQPIRRRVASTRPDPAPQSKSAPIGPDGPSDDIPAPAAAEVAPVLAMPRVVLSKFRHAEAPAAAGASEAVKSEVGADRSSELARIPIVRVRRESEKKVPFLVRLLSSF